MEKAQVKSPDKKVLSPEVFHKLPTTVKFTVSNKILGVADPNE